MRTSSWFVLAAVLCGLGMQRVALADKKVYKCTNADGSLVFSPNPCGASSQELKVDAGSAQVDAPAATAPAPGSGAVAAPAPDNEADSRCRNEAQRLQVYPAEGNLQVLMQHQAQLVREYAAGQNASEAIKVQIGNLDSAIAAEEQRMAQAREAVDRTYRNAIAKCDARKAEQDRETERKHQADLQAESERQAAQKRQAEKDEQAKHPHDPNGG